MCWVVLISRKWKVFDSWLPDSFLEINTIVFPTKSWKTPRLRGSVIAREIWEWDMASWRILIWKLPSFGTQKSWPRSWLQALLLLNKGVIVSKWMRVFKPQVRILGKFSKIMLNLLWCLRMISLQLPYVKNRYNFFFFANALRSQQEKVKEWVNQEQSARSKQMGLNGSPPEPAQSVWLQHLLLGLPWWSQFNIVGALSLIFVLL